MEHTKSYKVWNVFAREKPRIQFFQDNHTRIGSKFPIQMPMSDVHGVNFRGPPLKEAIGKTAGRGPDIERDFPVYVDLEIIQSAFQLQSAASDIFPRRLHRDGDIRLEKLRRLRGNSSPDFDLPGHDRSLRLLAAREQAFGN